MITVTAQTETSGIRESHFIHPEWQAWFDASAYTSTQAREELRVPKATFYRRIAKEPTHIDRLAMRALYEGLEPFTEEEIAA